MRDLGKLAHGPYDGSLAGLRDLEVTGVRQVVEGRPVGQRRHAVLPEMHFQTAVPL